MPIVYTPFTAREVGMPGRLTAHLTNVTRYTNVAHTSYFKVYPYHIPINNVISIHGALILQPANSFRRSKSHAMAFRQHLQTVAKHNLRTLRDAPLAELSGSLGDLGTLLPLMIALSVGGSIDLASTLVFSLSLIHI